MLFALVVVCSRLSDLKVVLLFLVLVSIFHQVGRTWYVSLFASTSQDQVYADSADRFLTLSSSGNTGNTDMVILYDHDNNAILVESMKSKSGPPLTPTPTIPPGFPALPRVAPAPLVPTYSLPRVLTDSLV